MFTRSSFRAVYSYAAEPSKPTYQVQTSSISEETRQRNPTSLYGTSVDGEFRATRATVDSSAPEYRFGQRETRAVYSESEARRPFGQPVLATNYGSVTEQGSARLISKITTETPKADGSNPSGMSQKLEQITAKLNQKVGALGLGNVDDSLVLLVAAAVITSMTLIVIWMLIRG